MKKKAFAILVSAIVITNLFGQKINKENGMANSIVGQPGKKCIV